jgi:transcriptional regulator with XRE-family HTH domain
MAMLRFPAGLGFVEPNIAKTARQIQLANLETPGNRTANCLPFPAFLHTGGCYMPIAENLKYWMDVCHITTAALAEKSNVPDSTITKIRTRQTLNPNMETLKSLAKGLGITVNDLTDVPSVDDEELREALPQKLPVDSQELMETVLRAMRNQRIASDRTVAELRKDRNFWRKFSVVCLGILIPITIITLTLVLFMYWDLSHPTEGNILLNYAFEHYNLQ